MKPNNKWEALSLLAILFFHAKAAILASAAWLSDTVEEEPVSCSSAKPNHVLMLAVFRKEAVTHRVLSADARRAQIPGIVRMHEETIYLSTA